MLDKKLLEILACPLCKSDLNSDLPDKLTCTKCEKEYSVVDGIPVMLVNSELAY